MPEPAPGTTRIQLYSYDETAGTGRRRTREAWVQFGRASVERLGPLDLERFVNEVGRERWAFSLVTFFFDLQPQQNSRYRSVNVGLTFFHEEVVARYLAPSPRTEMLGFDGIAHTRGTGRSVLAWDLAARNDDDEGIPPASQSLLCVVHRPPELAEVAVELRVTALVQRRSLFAPGERAAEAEPERFRLSFETGDFVHVPE